jgi:AcrR family transcriptional regulator
MTADPETPLRADALRNRNLILAAAKRMFAERGPDVPLEEIAREAGVGIGTLYRRFPDRAALIRAVARDSFEHVLTQVRSAVEETSSAWDGLVRALRSSRELQLSVQLAVLSPLARETLTNDPRARQFRIELLYALDALVRAAQAEGTLRQDIGSGDVAWLISMLLRPSPSSGEGEAAWMASERALTLMLDGLSTRPSGSPLPGEPLTAEHFNSLEMREDLEEEAGGTGGGEER